MVKGGLWTDEERALVRENQGCSASELMPLLPGRTYASIHCEIQRARKETAVQPAVKEPGDYVEFLSPFLEQDFECMQIWLKWNGYGSYKVLGYDNRTGLLTLVCTAKG